MIHQLSANAHQFSAENAINSAHDFFKVQKPCSSVALSFVLTGFPVTLIGQHMYKILLPLSYRLSRGVASLNLNSKRYALVEHAECIRKWNIINNTNSVEPDETPQKAASHQDPRFCQEEHNLANG